jgi:hypothetical protein
MDPKEQEQDETSKRQRMREVWRDVGKGAQVHVGTSRPE